MSHKRNIVNIVICVMLIAGLTLACGFTNSSSTGNELEITQIKNVVIKAQDVTSYALRTGDTSNLSSVLSGQYLTDSEDNIYKVFNGGYYGNIIAHEEITFNEITIDPNGSTAKVDYAYNGTIQLVSLATNQCEKSLDNQNFGGIYFLEKISGKWYITTYQNTQSSSSDDWHSPCW